MSLTTQAPKTVFEHGQNIFIYCHARTKQVIYSLDRVMNNHHALKQITFMGKKSKPPVLRRDFWRPLATVTFPSGHQGLIAYRELREFRKRHEHEWSYEELGVKSKKEAWKKLLDQKANTVADLAAVLERQAVIAEQHGAVAAEERRQNQEAIQNGEARIAEIKMEMQQKKPVAMKGDQEAMAQYKALRAEKMRLRSALAKPVPYAALENGRSPHPLNDTRSLPKKDPRRNIRRQAQMPRMSMEGLRIQWSDLLDAEYAKTWPESVVHEELSRADNRNRHVHPPPQAVEEAEEQTPEQDDEVSTEVQEQPREVKLQPAEVKEQQTQQPDFWRRVLIRLRDGRQ